MQNIKWMYNGIKINGVLYGGHYTTGGYTPQSGIANDTITFYRRGYSSTPRIEGLNIKNDSDMQSDYFETDTIRIPKDSIHWEDARKAWSLQQIKANARMTKRAIKHGFDSSLYLVKVA
jgi:hypothetical protein